MKDPCSKEELYFIAHRAPKTSLDFGKEATMHSWAVQSAQLCLEQCEGRGLQLTASEVSMRWPKYEQIVVWGLQRTKSLTGDVGLYLVVFFLPSLYQTKPASPTVWFLEAMQHQVPALQKQEGGEALLSQDYCSAWHAVPTQGCRATHAPYKQAAPRRMLSRKTLCPEHSQYHKRDRLKAYLKLSDHL